eukprot:Colp12_sorted_trinity150504_noHs@24383
MDMRATVNALRELAAIPSNRVTIVKDKSCLTGLVLFLGNPDPEVSFAALQTLDYLAEAEENRPNMVNERNLVNTIKQIKGKKDERSEPVAEGILKKLGFEEKKEEQPAEAPVVQQAPTEKFFTVSAKKALTYTIEIQGLQDEERRKQVDEKLLSVKGIISFTFEGTRVTIRARTTLKIVNVCRAVAEIHSLRALQVVIQDGVESLVDVLANEDHAVTGYPPEEEDTSAKARSGGWLTRTGDRGSGKNDGGWFGSVSSYIAKSLYW